MKRCLCLLLFFSCTRFPSNPISGRSHLQGRPSRKELMSSKNFCYAMWKEPHRNMHWKQRAANCWLCMYSLALVMVFNTESGGTNAEQEKQCQAQLVIIRWMCTLAHFSIPALTFWHCSDIFTNSFQCGRMGPVLFNLVLPSLQRLQWCNRFGFRNYYSLLYSSMYYSLRKKKRNFTLLRLLLLLLLLL